MAHRPARHCRTLPHLLVPSAFALVMAQLGSATLLAAPGAAFAQAADSRSFQIPAGPLEDALNRFGQEAGLVLVFPPELMAGRTSPGLQGRHGARDGLALLLAGSGIRALQQPNGVYVFQAQPAA
ncbi:STN domain-containing protein, partial [Comamonas antarctica]